MYSAPKPNIYRTVKPPCRVNGRDCTDRQLGCHGTCERFIAYQAALKEEKATAWKANIHAYRAGNYGVSATTRDRRK